MFHQNRHTTPELKTRVRFSVFSLAIQQIFSSLCQNVKFIEFVHDQVSDAVGAAMCNVYVDLMSILKIFNIATDVFYEKRKKKSPVSIELLA